MAHFCEGTSIRFRQERDKDFLGCLAEVARAVQAVKVTAQEEGWGHEQMIAGMDEVLASEAVLFLCRPPAVLTTRCVRHCRWKTFQFYKNC